MADTNLPENLNPIKAAYFAGLIDGEGWVTLQNKKGKTGHIGYIPRIVVGMTCETTIRAIHEFFQCGTVRESHWHQIKNPNHKTLWYWETVSHGARKVAHAIVLYSITKKELLQNICNAPIRRGDLVGDKHHGALFTQQQVNQIRSEYKLARGNKKEVPKGWLINQAKKYNVKKGAIAGILRHGYGLPRKEHKTGGRMGRPPVYKPISN